MSNPLDAFDALIDTIDAEHADAVAGTNLAGGVARPAETGVQAVQRIADRAVALGARPVDLPAAPHICEISGVLSHTAAECAVAEQAVATGTGRLHGPARPIAPRGAGCTDCGVPDGRPCALSCPSNAHWDD